MRPCPIEVGGIAIEHALKLLLLEDQQVVEALLSYTSQEAFADCIGSGSVRGCVENLNSTGCRHTSETGAKFAVVITHQILRGLSKRGGFSKLLCSPSVGRISCDADVDHFARVQFDDEEGEQRMEEKVSYREKVAGPDLLCMGV